MTYKKVNVDYLNELTQCYAKEEAMEPGGGTFRVSCQHRAEDHSIISYLTEEQVWRLGVEHFESVVNMGWNW